MTYDKARIQLQSLRWIRLRSDSFPPHQAGQRSDGDSPDRRADAEAVACGRLRVGDLLPPARQIAKQIGVGRATVDRAISSLMKMGILVAEGPRGVRVAEPQREETPDHERPLRLYKMMRRLAVDAFHMGAKPEEVEDALRNALRGIYFEGAGGESYGSGAHDDAAGAADSSPAPERCRAFCCWRQRCSCSWVRRGQRRWTHNALCSARADSRWIPTRRAARAKPGARKRFADVAQLETLGRLRLSGLGLDDLGQPGLAPAIRVLLAAHA